MNHVEAHLDPHYDIDSNTLFGFWIYLMTDAILFATLFAAYAVLRTGTAGGPTEKDLFDLPIVLRETLILLASSFTFALAMLQVAKKHLKSASIWVAITFLLGISFLSLIGKDFALLLNAGNSWQKSAFLSSYWTLISIHALHIAFGLFFMVVFFSQAIFWGLTSVVVRRLSCLKMFWFFSYFVWVFMFIIVYLVGSTS